MNETCIRARGFCSLPFSAITLCVSKPEIYEINTPSSEERSSQHTSDDLGTVYRHAPASHLQHVERWLREGSWRVCLPRPWQALTDSDVALHNCLPCWHLEANTAINVLRTTADCTNFSLYYLEKESYSVDPTSIFVFLLVQMYWDNWQFSIQFCAWNSAFCNGTSADRRAKALF